MNPPAPGGVYSDPGRGPPGAGPVAARHAYTLGVNPVSRLAALLEGRSLRLGFLAAFLPLLLVLGLQVWWLIKLERTSVLAGRAVFAGFLDAVTTEVLYSYGPGAERALDVPASFLAPDRLERLAAHFRRWDVEGAKKLFAVRFSDDDWGTLLFYDPASESMVSPAASDEARAVTLACASFKLLHSKAIAVESTRLSVEERDPRNRTVLAPIVDRESRVVGVAGLILDSDHFTRRVLPMAVKSSIEKLFPRGGAEVVVSVRDGNGTLCFSTDPSDVRPADAERSFSFVFTDHRIGIRSRSMTPERLARVSFAFNLGLSLVAAALLIGGLALVLGNTAREMKLSRMKSDFVSNVSHELRTPLASIRVFGEFLRLGRAATPEKVREYGEYIEGESRRLTQLVNNILDFAKIESGAKTYRLETGDVAEVLSAALRTFEVRSKHEGFEVETHWPEEPVPPARIDADALGQAFHNLLDNAVKYSGDSRWICVGLERRAAEIVVSVEDAGVGISAEEQRKIFDRFHRVGTGLVHDVRGSGLGLAIVRHVVEAHGGRVTVESEPGRGSRFSVHLPVKGGEG